MLKYCPNCEEEVEVKHGICSICGEEFHEEVKVFEMDTFETDDDFSGSSWGSEFEEK